jgi:transcriptional regulator with XRE-family HTH domain
MAGKEPEFGATAAAVAANITRLRESGGLQYTGLSARLAELGWSLSPVALRRIEQGDRRVTVDDLVALAVALEVSPETLLMPYAENADDEVQITGWEPMDAASAWRWMQVDTGLGWWGSETPRLSAERGLPPFVYRKLMEDKAARAARIRSGNVRSGMRQVR